MNFDADTWMNADTSRPPVDKLVVVHYCATNSYDGEAYTNVGMGSMFHPFGNKKKPPEWHVVAGSFGEMDVVEAKMEGLFKVFYWRHVTPALPTPKDWAKKIAAYEKKRAKRRAKQDADFKKNKKKLLDKKPKKK